MSAKPLDLTGKRFGQLTAIERAERRENQHGSYHWICRCDCGRYLLCRADNLMIGHSRQCSVCANNRGHGSVFIERGDD